MQTQPRVTTAQLAAARIERERREREHNAHYAPHYGRGFHGTRREMGGARYSYTVFAGRAGAYGC